MGASRDGGKRGDSGEEGRAYARKLYMPLNGTTPHTIPVSTASTWRSQYIVSRSSFYRQPINRTSDSYSDSTQPSESEGQAEGFLISQSVTMPQ